MYVPQSSLNGLHPSTDICRRGKEQKLCRLEVEKERSWADISLTAYRYPLMEVSSFKYPGRLLLASEDNWLAFFTNHSEVHKKWDRLSRLLWKEVMDD